MANYIAYPMTEVPDYCVFKVKVPANTTLKAGNIVILQSIPSSTEAISGNYDVFAPTQPTTASLKASKLGIVVNGGNFETLSDGRRPDGNPDWTTYEYKAGEIATVVLIEDGMRFYISNDCLTSSTNTTAGDAIVGANETYTATSVAAASAVPATYRQILTVLANKKFRLGGLYGGQFASGSVVLAKSLVGNYAT